jgi:predicted transcriptional regulator
MEIHHSSKAAFHLNRLIDLRLVEKEREDYVLTPSGRAVVAAMLKVFESAPDERHRPVRFVRDD